MVGRRRQENPDLAEQVELHAGLLETQLAGEYQAEALTAAFGDFERSVVAATVSVPPVIEVPDGFRRLAAESERSRSAAEAVGDLATSAAFLAKGQTYRVLLDSLVEVPKSEPKPTKTRNRKMDRPKS